MTKLSEAQKLILQALSGPDAKMSHSEDWRAYSRRQKQWINKKSAHTFVYPSADSRLNEILSITISQYKALLKLELIEETYRKEWDLFKFDAEYKISEKGRGALCPTH